MLCRRLKKSVFWCLIAILAFTLVLKIRSKGIAFEENVRIRRPRTVDFAEPTESALNKSWPESFDSFNLRDRVDFTDSDGGSWRQGWDVVVKDRKSPLRVRIIPHSHLDTSWVKTFDEYYTNQVAHILDNVVELLRENRDFRFQWDAIAFLARWWNETATEQNRDSFVEFVRSGRLDLGCGGWAVPDEALNHFVAMVDQLALGHEWLGARNLSDFVKSCWSIDLFGYSSASVQILRESGINRLGIHRLHYSLKRYLAKNAGMLEFMWDDKVLTHATPFYSYDVPHTCGPNPEICCQFDFERLLLGGTCPWSAGQPVLPNRMNIHSRAITLLEQFRKKAELYAARESRIVLVELGDDFRYANYGAAKSAIENYKRLMDYMNSVEEWNVEVRFSTLSEYFDEIQNQKHVGFSGDFFPYSDRANDYWTGYYSTRPYLKTKGTQMLAKMRSASILNTFAKKPNQTELINRIRRINGFYTHHDAVTGTSKQYVIAENERNLDEMDDLCNSLIEKSFEETTHNNQSTRFVSLFNSALEKVDQLVEIDAVWPNERIFDDDDDQIVESQINTNPFTGTKQIAFRASIKALSIKTFRIEPYEHKSAKSAFEHPKWFNGSLAIYKQTILETESDAGAYLAQHFESKQEISPPKLVDSIGGKVFDATVESFETEDATIIVRKLILKNETSLQIDIQTNLKSNHDLSFDVSYRICRQNLVSSIIHTDSNGLQMVRRNIKKTLPKQANIFPIVTSASFCDDNGRINIASAQPRGIGFFDKDCVDLLLDRRTARDDSRGVGEALADDRASHHRFILSFDSQKCDERTVVPIDYTTARTANKLIFPFLVLPNATQSINFIRQPIEGLFLVTAYRTNQSQIDLILHAQKRISEFKPSNLVPNGSTLNYAVRTSLTGLKTQSGFLKPEESFVLEQGSLNRFQLYLNSK